MANSSQFSLPRITAPAASRRATAVQSYGGTKFSRIFEPAVVRTPRVTITSLIATGTPASGGNGFPSAAISSMLPGLRQRALFAQRQKCANLRIFFSECAHRNPAPARSRSSALGDRAANRIIVRSGSAAIDAGISFFDHRLSLNHLRNFKNVPSVSGAFFMATSCGSDSRRPSFTSSRMA